MQDSPEVCANSNAERGGGMRIVIDKAKRRLVLRQGRRELYRCSVQLGSVPVGHKQCEGDGKTPEGRYRVCSRNPKSKYYLALGISYPNERDALAALREKRIDRETYRAIAGAQRRRVRPDWDTPLGGWIMIHGEPGDGRSGAGDWTAGCVAVQNSDMDVLYRCGFVGLRVVIRA